MKNRWIMGMVGIVALAFTGCQKDPLKNLTANESRYTLLTATRRLISPPSNIQRGRLCSSDPGRAGCGQGADRLRRCCGHRIKNRTGKRGFQEVARSASPDLGINVSRVYSTSTGVISYPGYWSDYGSYYDPNYWGLWRIQLQ